MLVVGRASIGLYAAAFAAALGAHVYYVDTDAHRLAAAEKMGAGVHDRVKPAKEERDPYPVTLAPVRLCGYGASNANFPRWRHTQSGTRTLNGAFQAISPTKTAIRRS